MKTEFDEVATNKSPFHKLINLSKKDKDEKLKTKLTEKNKYFLETKNLNIKRLHLNSDICNWLFI